MIQDYIQHLVDLGVDPKHASDMAAYADDLSKRHVSAVDALYSFTLWAATPQGRDYWSDIAKTYL